MSFLVGAQKVHQQTWSKPQTLYYGSGGINITHLYSLFICPGSTKKSYHTHIAAYAYQGSGHWAFSTGYIVTIAVDRTFS